MSIGRSSSTRTRDVFLAPSIVALVSGVGLLSALIGDSWYDVIAWLALSLPLGIALRSGDCHRVQRDSGLFKLGVSCLGERNARPETGDRDDQTDQHGGASRRSMILCAHFDRFDGKCKCERFALLLH